jgi:hypothetical protein
MWQAELVIQQPYCIARDLIFTALIVSAAMSESQRFPALGVLDQYTLESLVTAQSYAKHFPFRVLLSGRGEVPRGFSSCACSRPSA